MANHNYRENALYCSVCKNPTTCNKCIPQKTKKKSKTLEAFLGIIIFVSPTALFFSFLALVFDRPEFNYNENLCTKGCLSSGMEYFTWKKSDEDYKDYCECINKGKIYRWPDET